MADVKRKISELESSSDLDGLYTIGVNSSGESVKVPLGEITETMQSEVSETATALIGAIPVASGTGTNSVISVNSASTNTAAGASSIALGAGNAANGAHAAAIGYANSVEGDNSAAIGAGNAVSGTHSGALGYNNVIGEVSNGFALGSSHDVQGGSSVAVGYALQTTNNGELAAGLWNSSTTSTDSSERTLMSVGNGSDDDNRKNALELKHSGDLYVAGGVYPNGGSEEVGAQIAYIKAVLHSDADLSELADAFAALGDGYATLYEVASTLRTFLQDEDATDETINKWKELEAFLSGITDSDTLSGLLQSMQSTLEGLIEDEASARKAADETLQGNIDAEETARKAADETLQGNIDAIPVASGTGTNSVISVNSTETNTAAGGSAISLGVGNEASGNNTVAVGSHNSVSSDYSNAYAIGGYNDVNGNYAGAFGQSNEVSGSGSIAAGYGLQTTNNYEAALGAYNESTQSSDDDSERTALSVGVGSESTRKNAMELKRNGDLYVGGTVYVNSTLPLACAIIETLGANGNVIGDTLAALQPYTYYYIDADGAFTWASDSGGSWSLGYKASGCVRWELLNEISITNLFRGFGFYDSTCTAILGLHRADFSKLTAMNYACYYFAALKTIEGLGVHTFAACTNAQSMFYGCSALESVDLSAATFSVLTNASYMLCACSSLTSVDLSAATFDALTNAESMFYGCSALTSVDLSAATFDALTTAQEMFRDCSALTSVDLSAATFDALTNAQSMLCACSSLTSVDLSAATFDALTTAYQMFYGCSALTSVDLSAATFSVLTNASYMFRTCSALTSVDLSAATFNVLTNAYRMFYLCSKLVTVTCPETGLDMSNVVYTGSGTGLTDAFGSCFALQSIYLANICAPLDLSASTVFLPECAVFIMNNAQDVTGGVDGSTATSYTIKFNSALEVTDDVEAAIAAAVEKGWTVTYGGTTYSE